MSRESCIDHKPRRIILIIRQDYHLLMQKDTTASALLSVLEYWANGEISRNPDIIDPWLGIRSIKEFEEMLLGIATDKQIRFRLKSLEAKGYIETKQESVKGSIKNISYRFMVSKLQSDLDALQWQEASDNDRCLAIPRRSNNRRDGGQITDEQRRSNNRRDGGQITDERRSNNRRDGGQITEQLYIRKEEEEEEEEEREDAHTCGNAIAIAKAPFPESLEVSELNKLEAATPESVTITIALTNKTNDSATEPETIQAEIVPASENDNENRYSATVQRCVEAWETKGVLPKVPMEMNQWLKEEMGEKFILQYRRSGYIFTRSNDLDKDFVAFVAKGWKGKDLAAAASYIKKLEQDPNGWETLSLMVAQWLTTKVTGNPETNIAQEFNKTQTRQQIENFLKILGD